MNRHDITITHQCASFQIPRLFAGFSLLFNSRCCTLSVWDEEREWSKTEFDMKNFFEETSSTIWIAGIDRKVKTWTYKKTHKSEIKMCDKFIIYFLLFSMHLLYLFTLHSHSTVAAAVAALFHSFCSFYSVKIIYAQRKKTTTTENIFYGDFNYNKTSSLCCLRKKAILKPWQWQWGHKQPRRMGIV